MKKLLGLLILSLASTYQSAFATDLLDVVVLAHRADPTFRAAQGTHNANIETLSQARAALFPILEASGSGALFNEVQNTPSGLPTSTVNNKSRSYTVQVTQPVFDLAAVMDIKRSQFVVTQADAQLKAAEQDLFVRASNAYFDVLEAGDTLRFTEAEKKANFRQLEQAQQRFKVGLDAITSVYDAKARYDGVVAREITSANNLANKIEALREITGVLHHDIVAFRSSIPLLRPDPIDITTWVAFANRRNYTLIAKRHETDAARYAVKVQNSQYVPRLNVVARYTDGRDQSFGISTFDSVVKDVGLQVVSPMFQGGSLVSRSRQRQASYEEALAQLDATEKGVVSKVRQAYNSVLSGISAVRADRQAVISTQSSLDSTEAAYKVGTRTIVDVLDKQKDLYDNERQLASDQYTYIRSILDLKLAAGVLSIADIEEINSWLKGNTADTTYERFRQPAVNALAAGGVQNNSQQTVQYAVQAGKDQPVLSSLQKTASLEKQQQSLIEKLRVKLGLGQNAAKATPVTKAPLDAKSASIAAKAQVEAHATARDEALAKAAAQTKAAEQAKAEAQAEAKAQAKIAAEAKAKLEAKIAQQQKIPVEEVDTKAMYTELPEDTSLDLLSATTDTPVVAKREVQKPTTVVVKSPPKIASVTKDVAVNRASDSEIVLQIAALGKQSNADALALKIRQLTHQTVSVIKQDVNHKVLYQVRVGPLSNTDMLYAVHDQLERAGLGEPLVITK